LKKLCFYLILNSLLLSGCNSKTKDFCFFAHRFYIDFDIPLDAKILLLTNPSCKKSQENMLTNIFQNFDFIVYDEQVYFFKDHDKTKLRPLSYETILMYNLVVLEESVLSVDEEKQCQLNVLKANIKFK
jgi:uncharacterized protein YcfL